MLWFLTTIGLLVWTGALMPALFLGAIALLGSDGSNVLDVRLV